MCVEVHGRPVQWLPVWKWNLKWIARPGTGRSPALRRWRSSLLIERVFCARCATPLIWDEIFYARLWVDADVCTGLRLGPPREIYVDRNGPATGRRLFETWQDFLARDFAGGADAHEHLAHLEQLGLARAEVPC